MVLFNPCTAATILTGSPLCRASIVRLAEPAILRSALEVNSPKAYSMPAPSLALIANPTFASLMPVSMSFSLTPVAPLRAPSTDLSPYVLYRLDAAAKTPAQFSLSIAFNPETTVDAVLMPSRLAAKVPPKVFAKSVAAAISPA